jgi:hypothetical protein
VDASQVINVSRLDPETAATLLAGLDKRDPRGIAQPADVLEMVKRGECMAITQQGTGQCVVVLNVNRGQGWINAAQGEGQGDITGLALAAVEAMARGRLDSIAFQTMRPGLVRKAEKRGYGVVGWILKKELPHA